MSSITKDYERFTDVHGLVQADSDGVRGKTSDNGIRFTAQYVRALCRSGMMTRQIEHRIMSTLSNCVELPGLYNRYPGASHRQESHDDYRGLALISFYTKSGIAQRILQHGRRHRFFGIPLYYYNNTDTKQKPTLAELRKKSNNAFLFRFPSLVAMLKVAAGEKLRWYHKLWVFWDIHTSSNEQDSFVFMWMLAIMMKDQSWYIDSATKAWQQRLRQNYIGGIGEVLVDYYGHQHPDGKWLLEDYG